MRHLYGADSSNQFIFQIVSQVLEMRRFGIAKRSPQSKFQIVSLVLEMKHFCGATHSNPSKFPKASHTSEGTLFPLMPKLSVFEKSLEIP